MERNAEFYRPPEKYHAYRPQEGLPGAGQWWYHDCICTNGHSFVLMFHRAAARASIWFDVCDPDGNLTHETPFFDPSAFVASTEVLDVKIGDNWMRGKFPRYELHFRSGNSGADLVYECLTQAVYEPPDGVYLGREQHPATPSYFAYVFRPRCRITGKLIINGKEIPIDGEGYADHQWKNVPPRQFQMQYWYWGKLYLPKHTLIWWDTQMNQSFGFQRNKWLWGLSGERLIEYSNHADMYVDLDDFESTPGTGVAYPRKMVLMIDGPRIQGTATYKVRHVTKKIPLNDFGANTDPTQWVGVTHYLRYLSDCHAEFEIEGEKFITDTQEVHEIGI